jgi:hypothetical protein
MITCSECVTVALIIQLSMSMRRVMLSSVVCMAVPHFFSTLPSKRYGFQGTVTEHKIRILTFCTILCETFLILRKIKSDIIINASRFPSKLLVILVRLEWNFNFLNTFSKNNYMIYFMRICLVVAEFFHVDRQTDDGHGEAYYSLFENFLTSLWIV